MRRIRKKPCSTQLQTASRVIRPSDTRLPGVKGMTLDRILRLPMLREITGLSGATLYRRIAEGTFPRPVKLGPNSVGWKASEVQEWMDSLPDTGPTLEPCSS
jgi:prophage regulatory protein